MVKTGTNDERFNPMKISQYHDALSKVCPIEVVRWNESSLSFIPLKNATQEQIQAANDLLQTFDLVVDQEKQNIFDSSIKAGYDCTEVHTSLNFRLRIDETGRQTGLEVRSQLERKKGALLITDLSPCPYRLEDVNGVWHNFSSVGQCLTVIEKGGDYYAVLLRNLNS